MPRTSHQQAMLLPDTTFIIDNGGDSLKAGFAPPAPQPDSSLLQQCEKIPNYLVRTRDRKTYVAAQTNEISQWGEAIFRRPVEHGQLVNWEAEKEIWDHSLFDPKTAGKKVYIGDPEGTTLVLTEAPNTMPALQKNADEIIMEEWGFGGYLRTIGPSLNAFNDLHPLFETPAANLAHSPLQDMPMECVLVVDLGYSCSTITPVFKGRPLQRAIRRLDLGGKHVTNLLKEIISIRHFDLHQDSKIVNDIKEDVSFVSSDLKRDMERTWKGNKSKQRFLPPTSGPSSTTYGGESDELRVEYILPDGIRLVQGYSRPYDSAAVAARKRKSIVADTADTEVTMTLGNERFVVPEVLFNPSDIGSRQTGLPYCIIDALSVLPPLVQATMLANVLVVGGTSLIPGLVQRLEDELRSMTRSDWMVRVRKMDDPVRSTWLGGARLASQYRHIAEEYAITKEQYFEHGSAWAARHFVQGVSID